MFRFWFEAVWIAPNGHTLTHAYDRFASTKKEAEKCANGFFSLIGNRLPDTYKFMGYSITKVEAIWNEENKNG